MENLIYTSKVKVIGQGQIPCKEGAEFAIEKCPVGAEFGGQNINFLMEVFCAIILKLEVICYHIIWICWLGSWCFMKKWGHIIYMVVN